MCIRDSFYTVDGEILGRIVADQILDLDRVIGKIKEDRILNKESEELGRIIGSYVYDREGNTLGYSDPELPMEYLISLFFYFFAVQRQVQRWILFWFQIA
eukprot:TRINITY_DN1764_c0_g2_i3.p2 TRINITY_DN1764_c0_g2~~TRINITY_DN1764_c0_g2_i3.p2  ORF type:complete len:100 (+),score=19.99 TRINITY_DN1764_c0_g2_i3:82-381(+)